MERAFSLRDGKLKVLEKLDWDTADDLSSACEDLIRSGSALPEIDVSLAGMVTTPHVNLIIKTAERCSYYGRPLTVRIGPDQMRIFEAIGFDRIGRLRIASAEAEAGAGAEA